MQNSERRKLSIREGMILSPREPQKSSAASAGFAFGLFGSCGGLCCVTSKAGLMFSPKNQLSNRHGKISSSDKDSSFDYLVWYHNYSDLSFWAILSCVCIDCAKIIIVKCVLLL